MPLAGLIGFRVVVNPDICAQLLTLKKKKEAEHKILEILMMRNLPPDSFYIPKDSWRDRVYRGEPSFLGRCS